MQISNHIEISVYTPLMNARYNLLRRNGFTPLGSTKESLWESELNGLRWIIDINWSIEEIQSSIDEFKRLSGIRS